MLSSKKSKVKNRQFFPGKFIFALLLVLYFLLIVLATQVVVCKGQNYVKSQLESERQVHRQKLQNHLDEVRMAMREFEWLEDFSKNTKRLTMDDKQDIIKDLRDLQAKGQNIFIDYNDFRYDTTLQIAGSRGWIDISELESDYQKTRGLNLAIERFVRGAENTLLFSTYPTEDSLEILMKHYEMLKNKSN